MFTNHKRLGVGLMTLIVWVVANNVPVPAAKGGKPKPPPPPPVSYSPFGGVVLTSVGPTSNDGARASFLQPGATPEQDKIVVAATTSAGGDNDFAVLRYRADGSLDPTFGGDGVVTTTFPDTYEWGDSARAAVAYPGGRILLAGVSDCPFKTRGGTWLSYDSALARYNADGSLDSTFAYVKTKKSVSFGTLTTDVSGLLGATDPMTKWDSFSAVLVQPDGKIVAGGSSDAVIRDFVLVRYTPEGKLDPDFGSQGDGIVTTSLGGADWLSALTLHQGKILAVGDVHYGGDGGTDFALARYNDDGSLDTSFGEDETGIVTTSIGTSEEAYAVAVYPSGSVYDGIDYSNYIVVAGYTWTMGSRQSFALARYDPDGQLDLTFGDGGVVVTQDPPGATIFALAIQPDGKIVAAGDAYLPEVDYRDHFAVARYNLDGTLDIYDDMTPGTAFGPDASGMVVTEIEWYSQVRSVLIQWDGETMKIIAAGRASSEPYTPEYRHYIALACYNDDGTLDETFGAMLP